MNLSLFTSTSDFGGAERMALAFLSRCDRRRFSPTLICLLGRGPLLEAARQAGIPCLGLDWRGAVDLGAIRAFRHFLQEYRIDLIHSFGLRADLVSRLLGNRLLGARGQDRRRIVCGLRDTGDWRSRAHTLADRWTAGRVDRFIANSEAARQAFIARERLPADRIVTIPNGLDLPTGSVDIAQARADFGVEAGRFPVLVQVANIRIAIKGYDVLLDVARRLADRHPGLLVLCVGQDYSGGRLAAMVAEQGLSDHVRLTGYCADVRAPLALADVFTLASRHESFPVSILEAMAAGAPVVASHVGGVPEIIRHGENGLLAPAGDVDRWTETLDRLIRDQAERRRLGEAGRQTVAERFTLDAMVERIQGVYEAVGAREG